ncbi:MAG TPA: hypothetical protein DDW93_10325 [Firmicutes bacterium]|nr:hypothetical protein [Bacillota bacterium]
MMEAKTIHTYKDRLQQAIALRKHPLKLCRLLGIKFLFKLMTGSLRVTEIESRVEEIVKVKGAGVISLFPEIGVDVDKPSDLELVRAILK